MKRKRLSSFLAVMLAVLMLSGAIVPMAAAAEPAYITFVNPLAIIDPQVNMPIAPRLEDLYDIFYHDQTVTTSNENRIIVDGAGGRAVYRIRNLPGEDGMWGLNNMVIAIGNNGYGEVNAALGILLVERYPDVILVRPGGNAGFFGGVGAPGASDRNTPASFVRQGTLSPGGLGSWNAAPEATYRMIGSDYVPVLWVPEYNTVTGAVILDSNGRAANWVNAPNPRQVQAFIVGMNV